MLLTRLLAAAGIGVGIATVGVPAQTQAPATEVYLAGLDGSNVVDRINISSNTGYDNQPSFLPDSSGLLFTSMRDGKQTDIYRYSIATQTLAQVTATAESEYSPTVTPDRRTFSVIRVEADKTQRLWRFDLDGSNPRVILENVQPVGYHAWIDETHLALFVLGSPATLQLADTKTGLAAVAATGIGRSILIRPGRGTVSYLATGETPRVLKELDPKTRTATTLVAPIEGSQDCAWTPDGMLLMASGTTVFSWRAGSTSWAQFATLADRPRGEEQKEQRPPAVTNITRLAVSPDGKWLAFVAEPAAR